MLVKLSLTKIPKTKQTQQSCFSTVRPPNQLHFALLHLPLQHRRPLAGSEAEGSLCLFRVWFRTLRLSWVTTSFAMAGVSDLYALSSEDGGCDCHRFSVKAGESWSKMEPYITLRGFMVITKIALGAGHGFMVITKTALALHLGLTHQCFWTGWHLRNGCAALHSQPHLVSQ